MDKIKRMKNSPRILRKCLGRNSENLRKFRKIFLIFS